MVQQRLRRVQDALINMIANIMGAMEDHNLIFTLFAMVEFLQVLYFSIGSQLRDIFSAIPFLFIQQVVEYAQLNRVLTLGSRVYFMTSLLVLLSVNLFLAGLLLYPFARPQAGQKRMAIGKTSSKWLSVLILAFQRVLFIPNMQVSYAGLQRCQQSNEYYTSIGAMT